MGSEEGRVGGKCRVPHRGHVGPSCHSSKAPSPMVSLPGPPAAPGSRQGSKLPKLRATPRLLRPGHGSLLHIAGPVLLHLTLSDGGSGPSGAAFSGCTASFPLPPMALQLHGAWPSPEPGLTTWPTWSEEVTAGAGGTRSEGLPLVPCAMSTNPRHSWGEHYGCNSSLSGMPWGCAHCTKGRQ